MHPTRDDLAGLIFGTLAEDQAEGVADHVEQCRSCEETMQELETASNDVIRTLRGPREKTQYEQESDCQNLLAVVAAIGHEPSAVSRRETSPSADELGTIRDYQLQAKLGQGGMGTVYKALHLQLEKIVALKVLPSERMKDGQAVNRFRREMKAVGRLSHRNIVGAHDAGEHEGTHYLVMEYVDGVDLSELVHRVGPLPIADACELLRQAAIGLQHAFEHGLVHRDIKPSNLMVTQQGQLKILDLGLARLHNGHHGELTSAGQMMGTIDYMAPEQTGDSHEVDIRADIYGLGATLFKLLCNRAPYANERLDTMIKKLNALATQPVPSIREHRDEVSEELAAIVKKMLAKDADERFASPEQVAEALEPFAEGCDLPALVASFEQHRTANDEPAKPSIGSTQQYLTSPMTDTTSTQADQADPKRFEPTVSYEPAREVRATDEMGATGSTSALLSGGQPGTALAEPVARKRTTKFLATLAGMAALIVALTVIAIQTDKGTIKVVSHDPDIEVTVKRNGEVVDGFEVRQRDGATSYFSGEYEIEIKGGKPDGVSITNEQFKLTRGKDVLVEITRVQQVASAPSGRLGRDPAYARWQPGPEENVLPGLIPRPAKFEGIKRWQIATRYPRSTLNCVDVSPDGKLAAVGDNSGMVRLYNAETLELVRILSGHTHIVSDVAWSPDGSRLASCGYDSTVRIWNTEGQTLSIMKSSRMWRECWRVDWHPDGHRIAVSHGDGLIIWNAETGNEALALDHGNTDDIRDLDWSADGHRLATIAFDGVLRIWNADGTKLFENKVAEENGWGQCVGWCPDSQTLVASGEKGLPTLYSRDGEKLRVLPVEGKPYPLSHHVVWNPEGTRFVTLQHVFPRVWTAGGDLERELTLQRGDHRGVRDAAWMPDGQSLFCIRSGDALQELIRLDLNDRVKVKKQGFVSRCVSGDFSPDGTQFVLGSYHQRQWQCAFPDGDMKQTGYIPGNISASWSPDGSLIAFSNGEAVYLAKPGEKEPRKVAEFSFKSSAVIQWNHAGTQFAVVGGSETAEVWNADGTKATTITLGQAARTLSWSPDDLQIVFGCGRKVSIHEPTGGLVREFDTGLPGDVYSVAWHPSSGWIALGGNGRIQLVTPAGKPGPAWDSPLANLPQVTWSPNGKWLAATAANINGGGTLIYDSFGKPGPELKLKHSLSSGLFAAWSRDSRYLLTLGNWDEPTIWDVEKQEPVLSMTILGENESVSFNAAGQIIHGDRYLVEDKLVVIVENEDGSLDLLKPSEFETRIGQSLSVEPYNTPAQHRELAEFVLEHGGQLALMIIGDNGRRYAGWWPREKKLPDDDFFVREIGGRDWIPVEHAQRFGELLRSTSVYALTLSEPTNGTRILSSIRKFDAENFVRLGVPDEALLSLQAIHGWELTLSNNSRGVEAIRHISKIASVKRLDLQNTGATDECLVHVATMPLEQLAIELTNVTDAGLLHLHKLLHLQQLDVKQTKVTAAGVTALSKALPNCRIEWDGGVIEPTTDPNRHLGNWVLTNKKGRVQIALATKEKVFWAESIEELPNERFHVTRVELFASDDSKQSDAAAFEGCAALEYVLLNFHTFGDSLIEAISSSRESLTRLHLHRSNITDAGIARSVEFTKLTELNVGGTAVTDVGLKHIAKLPSLEYLDISHCERITDSGLSHLRVLRNLTTLIVQKTSVTEAGVTALSQALPNCRIEWDGGVIEPTKSADRRAAEWVLSRGGYVHTQNHGAIHSVEDITNEAFEVLAINLHPNGEGTVTDHELTNLISLKSLTNLNLTLQSQISDEGVGTMASIKQLKVLSLWGTGITDQGLMQLATLEQLATLSLTDTSITDEGGTQLSHLPSLTDLYLNGTEIGDKTLLSLTKLQKLVTLDLRSTNVTNSGISHLVGLPLQRIVLNKTSTSDSTLELLSKIKSLQAVLIAETKVTEAGVTALSKALPNCRIEWDGGVIGPVKTADRRAAEWVLRRGGIVDVRPGGRPTRLEDLPDGDFQLRDVYLASVESDLNDEELRVLQEIDTLTLVSLNANTGLTDAVLDSLIASKETLVTLQLGGVQITDKGAARLAEFRHLTNLDLDGTQITDTGVEHLMRLPRLVDVVLARTAITDKAAEHLSKMASLTKLSIHGTKITDAGLEKLARLLKLRSISVYDITTDRSVELLAGMKALEMLEIGGPQLTDAGMVHLEQHPSLTALWLHPSAQITNDGLTSLAKIPMLKTLSIRQGVDTSLTDAGVAHLAKLSALDYLYLEVPAITDSSLAELARLSNLTTLTIHGGKVTEAGVTALSKAMPNCRIEWDGGVIVPTSDPNRRVAE
ncbi:MAG: protein kinase [Planctomycetaceae bacterium]|nr:protein kinase [Planctomycetales bacterium]MCB9923181.1 protein kinase [Planctomycetaceae bacterium]